MAKLLFICSSPGWGGTEKNAVLRAAELQARGHEVIFAYHGDTVRQRLDAAGVKHLEWIARGGDFNPYSIWDYYRLIRRTRPDVVYLAMNKDYWLGGLTAWLNRVPVRVLYLGIERVVPERLKYRLIYGRFMNRFIVNSPTIKETLLNSAPFIPDHLVYLILNGFPEREADPSKPLRAMLNLPTGAILVGAAGRLSSEKGFDLIPSVLQHLNRPNVHIAIAGDGPLRDELIAQFGQTRYSDRIHLIGFQDDMSSFYSSLDLFVLFSRVEGMANVLNEAMSYGIPVVSTRVSGADLLLQNGKLAPIVEVDDVPSLALAIHDQLASPRYQGTELQMVIREKFSIHRMMDETEQAFGLR